MNYLPTCTSRLVVQHPTKFHSNPCKDVGGVEKTKNRMIEWRTKQTLNAPLPFYGRGIKMTSVNINWIQWWQETTCNFIKWLMSSEMNYDKQNWIICWQETTSVDRNYVWSHKIISVSFGAPNAVDKQDWLHSTIIEFEFPVRFRWCKTFPVLTICIICNVFCNFMFSVVLKGNPFDVLNWATTKFKI